MPGRLEACYLICRSDNREYAAQLWNCEFVVLHCVSQAVFLNTQSHGHCILAVREYGVGLVNTLLLYDIPAFFIL